MMENIVVVEYFCPLTVYSSSYFLRFLFGRFEGISQVDFVSDIFLFELRVEMDLSINASNIKKVTRKYVIFNLKLRKLIIISI